ncbi:cytochrome P450 [Parathielavia hyrcaniae]|uniref:Cytochrome P450 n=1 Tax=Parathielavia hyrcaniae TaxID=113614 RepID=A0AAN6T6R5_9PEZI|nr:cytochrome P450 [Parathielavia hyrcaniae]
MTPSYRHDESSLSQLTGLSLSRLFLVSGLGGLGLALVFLYRALFPPVYDRRKARQPKTIRSTIPLVGHLISSIREGAGYFERLYKSARLPICTLPELTGKRYVLNSPTLISAAMRCPNLSPNLSVMLICKNGLAANAAELERLKEPGYIEALRKTIAGHLNRLGLDGGGGGVCEVPHVGDWLMDVLSLLTMTAFYGSRNPIRGDRLRDIWLFYSNLSVSVMNLAPRVWAPQALTARARIQATLLEFYEARYDQGPDVSPFMFIHVFSRPDYVERVREEAADAVKMEGDSATVDVGKLNKQPFINAFFQEVQHGREYLLEKGAGLQWFNGVRHSDHDVWGPDTETFNPDRFMNPGPGDEKRQRGSFIPFGEGKHMCPGRQFAVTNIKCIVRSMALLFDVEGVTVPPSWLGHSLCTMTLPE